jgi:phosphopantothenoylcysteine decarboxylase / phosphopantothenate---cysteine ligase
MEPASGYLACGEEGMGRLPEPADIVDRIVAIMMAKRDFSGKTMLVTAAGTQEPIDPVRYIGNRSSGKMGYAIAQAARDRGARVILISGPTFLPQPHGIEFIAVQTAQEMKEAVLRYYGEVQVVIKAAAVADYRPQQAAEHKIKKLNSHMTIELEKNPDILWELGQKKQHQILVGFAAETQSLLENAREKLERKNLDMLVANDVTIAGAGFNTETNIVKLLLSGGAIEELPLLTKKEVAEIILDKIDVFLQRKC